LINTRTQLRALHRSWLTARGALQVDIASFITSTCQPVSWRLLSEAHTLRYSTIQDPCVVDIVDSFGSRSRLIICQSLRRRLDTVVSTYSIMFSQAHISTKAIHRRTHLCKDRLSWIVTLRVGDSVVQNRSQMELVV
jgi:hypothetical protein